MPNPTAVSKQPSWVKSSFVLRWAPGPNVNPTVKLVVFQPTVILRTQLLVSLFKSAEWTEALDDPYKLVDLVLLSWYERTDEIALEVKNQVRVDETVSTKPDTTTYGIPRKCSNVTECRQDIFGLAQSNVGSHDLHLLHTNAKSTTFMVEALDAATRATEMALASHENRRGHRNRGQGRKALWRKVHESLRYRQELFHSTRLTMLSTQSRVQNAISLVCTPLFQRPYGPYLIPPDTMSVGLLGLPPRCSPRESEHANHRRGRPGVSTLHRHHLHLWHAILQLRRHDDAHRG